jgi:hypothetical protein
MEKRSIEPPKVEEAQAQARAHVPDTRARHAQALMRRISRKNADNRPSPIPQPTFGDLFEEGLPSNPSL